jgi:phosphoserine phosphatase
MQLFGGCRLRPRAEVFVPTRHPLCLYQKMQAPPYWLVVDLDDTLIETDINTLQIRNFIKRDGVVAAFLILLWLSRGKGYLKRKMHERELFEVGALPYRESVVTRIRDLRTQGVLVLLASASDELTVKKIADHLGIFDESMGSTPERGLKGSDKLRVVKEFVSRMNAAQSGTASLKTLCANGLGFYYVGDSRHDVVLWQATGKALAVKPGFYTRCKLKWYKIPIEDWAS